jgi:hypothetical protein
MKTKVVKDEYFWIYFAACIDCDGWITTSNHKNKDGKNSDIFRYVVGFTQHINNEIGVKWIANQLEVRGIKLTFTYRNSNTPKEIKMINITIKQRESVVEVFKNIIPFLRFKKEKAKIGLKYTENRIRKYPLSKYSNIILKNKTNVYWRKSEVDILIKMVDEGFNNVAIGVSLNRSYNSVAQKIKRLGISR